MVEDSRDLGAASADRCRTFKRVVPLIRVERPKLVAHDDIVFRKERRSASDVVHQIHIPADTPIPTEPWDGRVGGDMDLVDYVTGRTSFFAEYDVVMGNQLRPFDPNQGNYTFEGATSIRAGGTEIAGVFHHYSQHLSDRLKTEAVSVNVVGGRLLRRFTTGKVGIDARADIGKVVQRSFLDYTWRTQLNATARRPITPLVGWF